MYRRNYTAAMLNPEGLKTVVFAHRNSFPNISTRGSGYEIYCIWPIWPPREQGPLDVVLSETAETVTVYYFSRKLDDLALKEIVQYPYPAKSLLTFSFTNNQS